MKRLAFIFCLVALPAFAEDAKPPLWVMIVQLKSGFVSATYTTPEKCQEAKKLIAPHLKKIGRADCLPVVQ